jgi:hypothetical protein
MANQPVDLQSLMAHISDPRVVHQINEDLAKVIEAYIGVTDRAEAHETLREFIKAFSTLVQERNKSLGWSDSQLISTAKEVFLFAFENEYQSARGGLFTGRSHAEATSIALQKALDYTRNFMAASTLTHSAGYQNITSVEASLLQEIVKLAGRSGFPAHPIPPQSMPGHGTKGGQP